MLAPSRGVCKEEQEAYESKGEVADGSVREEIVPRGAAYDLIMVGLPPQSRVAMNATIYPIDNGGIYTLFAQPARHVLAHDELPVLLAHLIRWSND